MDIHINPVVVFELSHLYFESTLFNLGIPLGGLIDLIETLETLSIETPSRILLVLDGSSLGDIELGSTHLEHYSPYLEPVFHLDFLPHGYGC